MKMLNRAVFATLAASTLAFTAACGGGAGTGNSGSGETVIGVTLSTLSNTFFTTLRDAAQKAADGAKVKLVVQDAQNDAATQLSQVQNFVSQGVKAIIINPVDSDQATPAAKLAENAKIPVIAVDRTINNATVAASIASDNVQGGQLAADTLAKLVGTGDVLHLQGVLGTSASRDRGQGFTTNIKNAAGIKVAATQTAEFEKAKGMSVTTDLLQAQAGAKGVFAENDDMALGAVQALGDRAGKDVKVVGFDGTADAITAIEAGKLSASVAQQPAELGKLAIEQAVKAAKGEKTEAKISVPVKVITKDNLAEFKK
ncbi:MULTISPECIES: substrate-binding domain-containing protein [unclassified Crossiella]|uniref:substrate-binding domain-containing protein n=1 Tax=unclassified Crossiella TaxID=2620835 RepID=UPI001FFE9F1B|nr:MULTISPECIES: substrate-binding domain-containing protein [unclassified Crossiella]MCK2236261.1 substrate-binding domain-containing protein [Crossiella sp. S99.2]MCK2249928.1 substrate-binding domain-containing protein [Crossiella sp. S99.1]